MKQSESTKKVSLLKSPPKQWISQKAISFIVTTETKCVKRYPLTPPHYLSLLTMSSSLPAGDQLVVRGGNAHFFTYT